MQYFFVLDRKHRPFILLFFLSFAVKVTTYAQVHLKEPVNNLRTRSFNADWRFIRDSVIGAEAPGFDDSDWRLLDTPHDWSIEDLANQITNSIVGPFSKASTGGAATGHVFGGTGWYRKKFVLYPNEKNKKISIQFDGVYMETDVWVNGKHVGYHPYGYTTFYYDITPFCKPAGQENVIAVKVNDLGKNSRWYTGSGIYRHVWLAVTNPVHAAHWGIYITTPEVSKATATVRIANSVINEMRSDKTLALKTRIYDPEGKLVSSATTQQKAKANSKAALAQNIKVAAPKLWSINSPHLYRAETGIWRDGKLQDKVTSTFGIRTIQYSAEQGFILNGEKILLKGSCMHHDNGPLGAAAIDRAEERRVELMKANGFNAIRCAHNPPSPAFLEACDRLGILVIDEAFDMWEASKSPMDYHRFFKNWWQRDIQSMVLRDRNHPSIILWSIGNEIYERADTSGVRIAKQLIEEIKRYDPTRLTTVAICEFWDHPGRKWAATEPAFSQIDVGSYNYQWWQYEPDHKMHPKRIMMGTESVPKHAFDNRELVEKHPWVIGDFVWTSMDYLGESGIGHTALDGEKDEQLEPWPWYNGYCGDIDLIGYKKPQSYFRDIVWSKNNIVMAVHTPLPEGRKEVVSYWGWPGNEGEMMQVAVYSRCPIVRLALNGKLIGEKQIVDSNKLTAKFNVPYAMGALKAIGIENGSLIDSFILMTTGKPYRLRLKADRTSIKASRNDLSFVTVEVVDVNGNLVPNVDYPVQFTIEGSGELGDVGSGNPADMSSFKQP